MRSCGRLSVCRGGEPSCISEGLECPLHQATAGVTGRWTHIRIVAFRSCRTRIEAPSSTTRSAARASSRSTSRRGKMAGQSVLVRNSSFAPCWARTSLDGSLESCRGLRGAPCLLKSKPSPSPRRSSCTPGCSGCRQVQDRDQVGPQRGPACPRQFLT